MGRGRVCCGTSLHLYSGSSRFESQSTCSLYRLRVFVSFLSSSYHSKLKEVMTVPFHILTHPPFMIIFILITIAPKRSTVVMTQAAFGRNGDGNVTIPGSGPWYLYIRWGRSLNWPVPPSTDCIQSDPPYKEPLRSMRVELEHWRPHRLPLKFKLDVPGCCWFDYRSTPDLWVQSGNMYSNRFSFDFSLCVYYKQVPSTFPLKSKYSPQRPVLRHHLRSSLSVTDQVSHSGKVKVVPVLN
jgi:hypothetical protein